MLKYVSCLIQLFNYGLLYDIQKYSALLDMIYIRHRGLEDLNSTGIARKQAILANEIKDLVVKLPHFGLTYQTPKNRDALH